MATLSHAIRRAGFAMLYFLQQVLNGFHSGALYALLAFGYAISHGVLKQNNLSYGAVFAFCGQTMILAAVYGWQVLWLTLPATVAFGVAIAFAYAVLVSRVLSQSVFPRLMDTYPNIIIAASLGVLLVLGELGRIAADTHDLWLPPMLAEPVVFLATPAFRVTLTPIQLVNCGVTALVIAVAGLYLARSQAGLFWRAVADDRHAAALCGVDVGAVFRRSVLASGLIAALAGIMAALYYGNISFGTGLTYGLKILFVTALGGYGAPVRAAAGAAAFGMAEALWAAYFPLEWRDAWIFALLAAMLVLRLADRRSERMPV